MQRRLMVGLGAMVAGGLLQWAHLRSVEHRLAGGEPVSVLVVLEDVGVGDILTDRLLGTRNVPSAYVDSRYLGARDRADVIGESVAVALRAGEALLWSDLTINPAAESELAERVRPGMRAVGLRLEGRQPLLAFLRAGDRVDVLYTPGVREGAVGTRCLLQGALLLAVGDEVAQADGTRAATPNHVTLSLDPEAAQRLADAQHSGALTLALRHPDDTAALDETVASPTVEDATAAPQAGAKPAALLEVGHGG